MKTYSRRQLLTVVTPAAAIAVAGLAGCTSSSSSSAASASASASASAASASASAASASASAASASASSAAAAKAPEKIIFAWEPSNSGESYLDMRDAMAAAIEKGTGIPCEAMTTTDYNMCIEALSSGKAHIASLGASEYVEIHKRNPAIVVGFVLSDSKGQLNPVSYYSQILCREGEQDKYMKDGVFDPETLRGEKYSFVSLSSTSGYVIPATIFSQIFGTDGIDEFAESGKFFDEVVMSSSQPLSVYQVVSGNVNLCSCDNTSASAAYDVVEGENGTVGCVYKVKDGLEGELAQYAGQRLVCIESYPVPAVPFCINTAALPSDVVDAIVDYMTSDEVAQNRDIFVDPDNPAHQSKYKAKGETRFVPADDSYYDDYRELIGKK